MFLFAGLKTSAFERHPTVLQVMCSAETLDSSSVLLTMTLYSPSHEKENVIASVSVVKNKCTTSTSFSSCLLDEHDSRKSKLVTLVTDLGVGESRSYGCTVGYETNGWTNTITWSTVLRRNRRFFGGVFGLLLEFFYCVFWGYVL